MSERMLIRQADTYSEFCSIENLCVSFHLVVFFFYFYKEKRFFPFISDSRILLAKKKERGKYERERLIFSTLCMPAPKCSALPMPLLLLLVHSFYLSGQIKKKYGIK